jgi:hypothetical protein
VSCLHQLILCSLFSLFSSPFLKIGCSTFINCTTNPNLTSHCPTNFISSDEFVDQVNELSNDEEGASKDLLQFPRASPRAAATTTSDAPRVQQPMQPTSRYVEGLVLLITCKFQTLIHDRIQWKCCNPTNLEI